MNRDSIRECLSELLFERNLMKEKIRDENQSSQSFLIYKLIEALDVWRKDEEFQKRYVCDYEILIFDSSTAITV